jgi:histidinol phosphatase-like enzyme
MNYIKDALTDYLGVPVVYSYCPHNDKDCPTRKPNTYMLRYSEALLLDVFKLSFPNETKFMIGDASGKEGQFSDSDRKTAENYDIDYMDVNDFVQLNRQ